MILGPNDSIGNVLSTDANYSMVRGSNFDYHVPPVPDEVRNAFRDKVDYDLAVNTSLTDFQTDHLRTQNINFGEDFLVRVHYGFNGAFQFPEEVSDDPNFSACEKFKKTIFSSRILRETIYNWLIGSYKNAFSIMSIPEQHDYLQIFRDGKVFAEKFDLEEERSIAEMGGYHYTRGQLNAFIYRRIANEELTKEECIEWLTRIIADLESVAKTSTLEEDNYVLIEQLNYDYYVGCIYTEAGWYTAGKISILRKENEQYQLLPGANFQYCGDFHNNLITGRVGQSESEKQRGLFYGDSTMWLFTSTTYDGPTNLFFVRGQDRSSRLLMITGQDETFKYGLPSGEPGKTYAVCTLLDLDSGYIVQDSMYFEVLLTEDPETFELVYLFPSMTGENEIFLDQPSGLYGIMDAAGNIVVKPMYKSIQATSKPDVFKVNGRRKIDLKKLNKR